MQWIRARARGAAAQLHPIVTRDRWHHRNCADTAHRGDTRHGGGGIRRHPVLAPGERAKRMGRRPQRRMVVRRWIPADRQRGEPSGRTLPGDEALTAVTPAVAAVLPAMTRAYGVRRGRGCARGRVPRGDGNSARRRGGRSGGCRGDGAREREHRRGGKGRYDQVSLHEGTGSSVPG